MMTCLHKKGIDVMLDAGTEQAEGRRCADCKKKLSGVVVVSYTSLGPEPMCRACAGRAIKLWKEQIQELIRDAGLKQ